MGGDQGAEAGKKERVVRLVVCRRRAELLDMLDAATRDLAIAVRVAQNMIHAIRERAGLLDL